MSSDIKFDVTGNIGKKIREILVFFPLANGGSQQMLGGGLRFELQIPLKRNFTPPYFALIISIIFFTMPLIRRVFRIDNH